MKLCRTNILTYNDYIYNGFLEGITSFFWLAKENPLKNKQSPCLPWRRYAIPTTMELQVYIPVWRQKVLEDGIPVNDKTYAQMQMIAAYTGTQNLFPQRL